MKYLAFTFALVLSGCGGGNDTESVNHTELLTKVSEQRQIWINRDVKSYVMTYYYGVTGCPTIDLPLSIQVTVVDGKVQVANYVPTGELISVDSENVRTIDELFDLTIQQINKTPTFIGHTRNSAEAPKFDSYFGFPSQIFFDFSANEQCDDITLNIQQFS